MYHGSRAGVPRAVQRTELQRLIGKASLSPFQVVDTWTDFVFPAQIEHAILVFMSRI
jgi:hypothetical protein